MKNNLAWAAWLTARLGGWKGYAIQRPPGVITLYEGWVRFHAMFLGWLVAKDVYKRQPLGGPVFFPCGSRLRGNQKTRLIPRVSFLSWDIEFGIAGLSPWSVDIALP